MLIEDGSGGGYKTGVDSNNRMKTYSYTRTDTADNSIRIGDSYEMATGSFITLATDTNEHAIMYVKNTSSTKSMLIESIRTCGTASLKWILYKNDTGGDLISDGNAGAELNHNFHSTNVAPADLWVASASGKTRSGGTWMSQHIDSTGHSIEKFNGYLILGTNDSLTLTAQNTTAVASTDCCVRVHAYFEAL